MVILSVGLSSNPIAVSSYTQVKQIQSAAGVIATVSGSGGSVDNAAIADAIWDEALSGHLTSGSAGFYLYNAGGSNSPETIAAAIWNASVSSFTGSNTFGQKVGKKLLTLAQFIALKK